MQNMRGTLLPGYPFAVTLQTLTANACLHLKTKHYTLHGVCADMGQQVRDAVVRAGGQSL